MSSLVARDTQDMALSTALLLWYTCLQLKGICAVAREHYTLLS